METNSEYLNLPEHKTATFQTWKIILRTFFSAISIEPVLFVATFIMSVYSTISNEYIFHVFSIKYGVQTNTTDGSKCNASDIYNQTAYDMASSESSQWILYLNCAGLLASCFSSTLLGVWGDKVGRKPVLIISCFSFVILIAIYLIVFQLHLPIQYLILARLFCGLLGDFPCIIGTCFAVIADISTPNERTFRMAIGEASLGFGGVIAYFISGIWQTNEGYVIPLYGLLACAVGMIIYVVIIVPGSMWPGSNSILYLLKLKPLQNLFFAVKSAFSEGVTLILFLLMTCFALQFIFDVGINDVLNVYEQSQPFCWSTVIVGYSYALCNVGMLANIPILHFSKTIFIELKLLILGAISMFASSLVLSLSVYSWMLYFSFCLMLFSRLPAPILRSQMSQVIKEDTQGALFSLIACLESIMALAASFLYNGIFSLTVKTSSPGSVFYVGVACSVLFIPVYCMAYYKIKPKIETNYNVLVSSPVNQ